MLSGRVVVCRPERQDLTLADEAEFASRMFQCGVSESDAVELLGRCKAKGETTRWPAKAWTERVAQMVASGVAMARVREIVR